MSALKEIKEKQVIILNGMMNLMEELKRLQVATGKLSEPAGLIDSEYIPDSEALEALKISRPTWRKWQKEGRVTVLQLARGKAFVKKSEVMRILKEAEQKSVA